jgi:hypothetical protein
MRLLPSSARTRRRLGILGVVVALAGAVWVFSMLEPAPKKVAAEPLEPGAPQMLNDHQVPLKAADRKRIDAVLDAFVPAAVERKDPLAAYRLATPELRKSATPAEWRKGNIPVYPYPASERRDWTLNFSFPRHVSLDLFIQPRPSADVGPIAFTVEVRRFGKRRWLVDSFFPTAMFPKPTKESGGGQPLAQPDLSPANVKGTSQTGKARVSPLFFLVPVGLMGVAFLIPFVMFFRGKLREARAERIYARTPRGTLPPLPKPQARSEPERDRVRVP